MEAACSSYFSAAKTRGRPSIAPGVYFRILLIGYFEGIESERGLEWRCLDSLSLREFLGLLPEETVRDHSTLSRMRKRFGTEVYDTLFKFVLGVVGQSGLLEGKAVGVDSTYLRADASMKAITRRDSGEVYADYIKRLAKESGIENPTIVDARRLDRKRNVKKRYLAHIAGLNLAIVLRKALGAGTPRGIAAARKGLLVYILVIWTAITTMLRRLPNQLWHGIRRWWSAGQNCIGLFGMEAACPKVFSSTGC